MKRAIREHLTDFLAILGLVVLALATTSVILSQQQQPYPSWVPIIGDDTVELQAELSSAQAVTPGQGQTVNIAGIEVGDITEVTVEEGRAVVTMAVGSEYAELIHPDARVLLRPRTGLQDMTLEIDAGDAPGTLEEGDVIPSAQTAANVNPDRILASLDGDTRTYLQLLLDGGARGLGDSGPELSAVMRRFEPTARDLARINGALSKRRENIARSITNLRLVSEELGAADTQLGEFVTNSNAVLESFASQEGSLRESFQRLPGALRSTRAALESGDALALELGPASRALIPSAEALGPALRETRPFFRKTVGPIRDQIRPFTRQVQPPVRDLRDTAAALNETTPALTRSLGGVNRLFNTLAFNPPGQEEGYLFWLAWLNHNQNGMFSLQDGHGPLRRGIVLQSCGTARIAETLSGGRPILRTLQELSGVPRANDNQSGTQPICPLDP